MRAIDVVMGRCGIVFEVWVICNLGYHNVCSLLTRLCKCNDHQCGLGLSNIASMYYMIGRLWLEMHLHGLIARI